MAPILPSLPLDILDHIAYRLALVDLLGPPSHLVPLLQTCRSIYAALSITHNVHLYARIFRAKFDYRAPARRFGSQSAWSRVLAEQLVHYCTALNHIRAGDLDCPTLLDDFYRCFALCSENDGRNAQQLQWANLPDFVHSYVFSRLWHDRNEHTNWWPLEDGERSFALWLFWFTLTPEKLASMSLDQRAYLQILLRPYAVYNFRYPPFLVPDIHFHLPLLGAPEDYRDHSTLTPHGTYPQYREPEYLQHPFRHYGHEVTIAEPPIGLVAKLLYVALLENQPQEYPSTDLIPADRAAAIEMGLTGPTLADYLHFGAIRAAVPPEHGDWDWRAPLTDAEGQREDAHAWSRDLKSLSSRHENDWERWRGCSDPWADNADERGVTYTYGSLSGLWGGRLVDPFIEDYILAMNSTEFHTALEQPRFQGTSSPLFFRLREHHCISPEHPLPRFEPGADQLDEGVMNAYMPRDFPHAYALDVDAPRGQQQQRREKLHIRKRGFPEEYVYETYVDGLENSHDEDTCHLCARQRERDAEDRLHMAEEEDVEEGMSVDNEDDEHDEQERERERERERARIAHTKRVVQQALGDEMDIDEFMDRVEHDYREDQDQASSSVRSESRASYSSSSDAGGTEVERMCSGILDIIITGETPHQYATAWRDFRLYGRVRAWDGLIVLVRAPVSSPAGRARDDTYVFRGYLVGGRTLVGAWRHVTDSVHSIPVEGTFVVSRLPEPPVQAGGAGTGEVQAGDVQQQNQQDQQQRETTRSEVALEVEVAA